MSISDEQRALVADGNVQKINVRFAELEKEIRTLREDQKVLENMVGNCNNMIQAQTNMIQQLWVQKYGTGET